MPLASRPRAFASPVPTACASADERTPATRELTPTSPAAAPLTSPLAALPAVPPPAAPYASPEATEPAWPPATEPTAPDMSPSAAATAPEPTRTLLPADDVDGAPAGAEGTSPR